MIDIETANQLKSLIDINTIKESEDQLKPIMVFNSLYDVIFLLKQMKDLEIISKLNTNKDLARIVYYNGKQKNENDFNKAVSVLNNQYENYNNRYTIIEVEKLNKLESRLKELENN